MSGSIKRKEESTWTGCDKKKLVQAQIQKTVVVGALGKSMHIIFSTYPREPRTHIPTSLSVDYFFAYGTTSLFSELLWAQVGASIALS